MAEKITFGAKVETELNTEIKARIAELGLTGEEYILQSYQAFERSKRKSAVENDIEIKQVEDLLIRVNEVFVGLCKSRQDVVNSKNGLIDNHLIEIEEIKTVATEEAKKLLGEIEEIKTTSSEKVKAAEVSRNETTEQMKILTADFKKQTENLTKTISDLQKELDTTKSQVATQNEFITELKLQKEQLANTIAQSQNKIEQAEKIKTEFEDFKNHSSEKITELNQVIMDSKIEVQKAVGAVEGQKQQTKIQIERLAEKQALEIERLEDKHKIEIEKLKLELQTKSHSEIQDLREQYNRQTAEMLQGFTNSKNLHL